jgi:hypothetical protein
MDNMEESMGLKGSYRLENMRTGQIVETPNTIVTVGKSSTATLLGSGLSVDPFGHIAIGIGSSTIAAGDTELGSEAYREASANSLTTTAVTNDTLQMIGSFSVDATKTINEAAVLNAGTAGSMLSRSVFSDISAVSGDSINVTYNIQVS